MSEMTHLLSAKCSTMDLEDIQILHIYSQQNVIGLVYKINDIIEVYNINFDKNIWFVSYYINDIRHIYYVHLHTQGIQFYYFFL